jgi:hypothetical protein
MKAIATIAFIVCGLLISSWIASAQVWAQTSANTNYEWQDVASSADGSKLAAIANVGVFISTNSGAAWTLDSSAPANVYAIASSADGVRLAAAVSPALVYTSTNSGFTWNQAGMPSTGFGAIQQLVSSADGSKLMTAGNNFVFVSTNSGTSWWKATNNQNSSWVTCSADGTKMAAIESESVHLSVSTNMGRTWQQGAALPSMAETYIFCTADGSKLIAEADGLYISTNWGMTWSITNNDIFHRNSPMVSSADASLLLTVRFTNAIPSIFSSTNLGATWISNSLPQEPWNSVACSADGEELIATAGTDYNDSPNTNGIWISQTSPSPQLNFSTSNNNLNFSWIVPSTNMVLEQSPDLNTWAMLTNTPSLNETNLQDQLTLSSSNGGSSFFRLVSQ